MRPNVFIILTSYPFLTLESTDQRASRLELLIDATKAQQPLPCERRLPCEVVGQPRRLQHRVGRRENVKGGGTLAVDMAGPAQRDGEEAVHSGV